MCENFSTMSMVFWEDDCRWALIAAVVMAVMGYGFYKVCSWIGNEEDSGNAVECPERCVRLGVIRERNSFRPFSFSGRIGRLQFLSTVLVTYGLWLAVLMVRHLLITEETMTVYNKMMVVLVYISFHVCSAQGVKRCHDIGHTGRFMVVPFHILVLLAKKGCRTDNEYGLISRGGKTGKGWAFAVGSAVVVLFMQSLFVVYC